MHKVQLGGCNYWLNPLWSNPMRQPGWRWEFPEFLATARHVLSHSGWNEFFETTGAELKRKIQGRKKKLCSRQLQLRWGSALAGGEQHFANWKAEVPISPRADTGTAGMSKYMSQCMGNPMRDWVPGSLSIGNPGRKKRRKIRRRSQKSNIFADQTAQLCTPGDLSQGICTRRQSRFPFLFSYIALPCLTHDGFVFVPEFTTGKTQPYSQAGRYKTEDTGLGPPFFLIFISWNLVHITCVSRIGEPEFFGTWWSEELNSL